ncbi:hypothetical protein QQX98_003421 [Neonectria punicea]|uniref:Fe2OG dioxygenase domain-containing protein n=1 Tax=Neonectria punicea TaxID=979145 RepID=A0ABR1HEI6_9HYPO
MTEVLSPLPIPQLNVRPILKDQLSSSRIPSRINFDAEKHLSYSTDPNVLSLKDISLPEDTGISHVACSDPFPLFSEEAIGIMRQEIFTTEAWKYPKTLSIISKVAGIDLIPNIEYEIGNINISVHDSNKDKSAAMTGKASDLSVTKWHYDSYPFVCVVMMSDASKMVGGETAIQSGTGEVLKVRGPQMGSAVVLQGRYICHQALAALGGEERITMITSFRPRDPTIKDDSVLTSIRPISDPSELYYQWTKYRVEVLQERLKKMLDLLEENRRAGNPTDVTKVKELLQQQESYLSITNKEIVENQGSGRARVGL